MWDRPFNEYISKYVVRLSLRFLFCANRSYREVIMCLHVLIKI